jgi:uncharacterized protein (DUF58 family)
MAVPVATATSGHGFLDPGDLARLASLELRARVVVEGALQGLHRSPFRGYSVEFAEYRPYLPGDDPSTIDWRIYARSDRYYVKRFELDTNLPCHLVVDASGSMAFGTGAVTKFAYATWLAAAFAYLLVQQRDAVGVIAFQTDVIAHVPPSTRRGQWNTLLAALTNLSAASTTSFQRPLQRVAEAMTRRGLVIVFSDLLDDDEEVVRGLRLLRARGSEVVVFHILDHAEVTLPYARASRFRDPESGRELLVSPGVIRDEYQRAVEQWCETHRQRLREAGVDYIRVDTSAPLESAVLAWLAHRGRSIG